jgi:hypothetical protein
MANRLLENFIMVKYYKSDPYRFKVKTILLIQLSNLSIPGAEVKFISGPLRHSRSR